MGLTKKFQTRLKALCNLRLRTRSLAQQENNSGTTEESRGAKSQQQTMSQVSRSSDVTEEEPLDLTNKKKSNLEQQSGQVFEFQDNAAGEPQAKVPVKRPRFGRVLPDEVLMDESVFPKYQSLESDSENEDNPPVRNAEANDDAIYVVTTENKGGKRKWDNIDFCYFCGEEVKEKLVRHLTTWHKTKPEVLELMKWAPPEDPEKKKQKQAKKGKKGQQETKKEAHGDTVKEPIVKLTPAQEKIRKQNRVRCIEELRRLGNIKHNQEVLRKGKGKMKPIRRCRDSNYRNFLECKNCGRTMNKTGLAPHLRRCTGKPAGRHCRTKAMNLRPTTVKVGKLFKEQVLKNMRGDDVFEIIREDALIMRLAQQKYNNNRDIRGNCVKMARGVLRELGRFMKVMRSIDPFTCRTLEDCLYPRKYTTLVEATHKLSEFDPTNNDVGKPQLALNIGPKLMDAIVILQNDLLGSEQKGKRYEQLIDLENMMRGWDDAVTEVAQRNKVLKRSRRARMLPLVQDLQKLRDYLKNTWVEIYELEEKGDYSVAYDKMCKTLMTQMDLFNRKRAGELSTATVADFRNRHHEINEEVLQALTPNERKLVKKMDLMKPVGKLGRLVPVILTPTFVKQIEHLLSLREKAKVPRTNPYLFAKRDGDGNYELTGIFRTMVLKADLEMPEAVNCRNLRTHICTIARVLDLSVEDLSILGDCMGHSLKTMQKYYRLPEDTLLLARCSKVFLAAEQGVHLYKGKALDKVQLLEDEEVTPLEEDMEEDEEDDEEDEEDDEEDEEVMTLEENKKGDDEDESIQGDELTEMNLVENPVPVLKKGGRKRTGKRMVKESEPSDEENRSPRMRESVISKTRDSDYEQPTSDSDADSENTCASPPRKKQRLYIKSPSQTNYEWDSVKKKLRKHFHHLFRIHAKTPPGKKAVSVFMDKYNVHDRPWLSIKWTVNSMLQQHNGSRTPTSTKKGSTKQRGSKRKRPKASKAKKKLQL